MSEINRFYPERGASMEVDPNGSPVTYADHITALQQQRKQVIAEVEEALTKLADEFDERAEVAHERGKTEARIHGENVEQLTIQGEAAYGASRLRSALATLTKGGTDGEG